MPWQNQTPDALGEERSRTIKSLEGAEGQVKKNKRSCEAEALRLPGGRGAVRLIVRELEQVQPTGSPK